MFLSYSLNNMSYLEKLLFFLQTVITWDIILHGTFNIEVLHRSVEVQKGLPC